MSSVSVRCVLSLDALWTAVSVAAAVAGGAATGCGTAQGSPPSLSSVTPGQAYSDAPFAIAICGPSFRPALALDTAAGSLGVGGTAFVVSLAPAGDAGGGSQAPVTASGAVWRGDGQVLCGQDQEIDALIPAGVAAGRYDVRLTDPRGLTVGLADAFTSLGSDQTPPLVTINSPADGAVVAPAALIAVGATADDGEGHIARVHWSASSPTLGTKEADCPITGQPAHLPCPFSFTAPQPKTLTEPLRIDVRADDSTGHTATASIGMLVAARPTVASVAPAAGPTTGGTRVVVTGSNFIPGRSEIRVDGVPLAADVGTPQTATSLSGVTLAHLTGFGGVTVATGASQSAAWPFEFVPPPNLRLLAPTSGPEAMPTAAALAGSHFRPGATRIFIGSGPGSDRMEVPADVISANRIEVTIPPGTGVVSIFAVDPISGEAELPDVFTYVPGGT